MCARNDDEIEESLICADVLNDDAHHVEENIYIVNHEHVNSEKNQTCLSWTKWNNL